MDERGWKLPMLQACVCEPSLVVIKGKFAIVVKDKKKKNGYHIYEHLH